MLFIHFFSSLLSTGRGLACYWSGRLRCYGRCMKWKSLSTVSAVSVLGRFFFSLSLWSALSAFLPAFFSPLLSTLPFFSLALSSFFLSLFLSSLFFLPSLFFSDFLSSFFLPFSAFTPSLFPSLFFSALASLRYRQRHHQQKR